jgi:hypothetical protein
MRLADDTVRPISPFHAYLCSAVASQGAAAPFVPKRNAVNLSARELPDEADDGRRRLLAGCCAYVGDAKLGGSNSRR